MRARLTTRTLIAATALTLMSATAATAGPPWISIEVPANPHHPSTRDALMLVRAYHHSEGVAFPMSARAEGIVDGKRVSVPLEIAGTTQPGLFAVRSRPDRPGVWVVVVTLKEGSASASALVALDGEGRVARVEVPSSRSRDGWTIPRAATDADIEAALRGAASLASNGEAVWARGGLVAAAPAGLILLLAIAALRRRR